MLKKSNIVALVLTLFFILVNSSVMAKAETKKSYSIETVNNVTVKANVNNFDGEIYFFIKDSKGMKRVFILNKSNNFSRTSEIPIGEAKMLDINMYDKNKKAISLPYSYNGELNTTADKSASFTINIDNRNTSTEDSTQELENKEETNIDSVDSVDESKQDNTTNEQEKVEQNNKADNEISPKMNKKTIINLIIDALLIVIVGGIALFVKYKGKKEE